MPLHCWDLASFTVFAVTVPIETRHGDFSGWSHPGWMDWRTEKDKKFNSVSMEVLSFPFLFFHSYFMIKCVVF